VWVPYGLFGNEASVTSRTVGVGNGAVGRLKAGVTIAQARAEMSAIAARLGEQYPESNKDVGARITPLIELIARDIRQSLLALQGAVALVLLIACANVANLLIARSATQEKELAIRSALGAGRSRLFRQLLLECLPLALLGGLVGLLLARWGLELLLKLLPDDIIPAETRIGIDARALCFTSFLTLLTTLICSLLPALRFSRSAVLDGLKDGAPGNQRMRGALVTLEVALSIVLLIGAGLLIKSFARMQQVDLGFRREFLLRSICHYHPANTASNARLNSFIARRWNA
jgi:putative ABC transport system permease protein